MRLRRVLRQAHHAHREWSARALINARTRKTAPALPQIVATIDVGWRGTRIEAPRASPIRQEGPDLFSPIRKLRTAERGSPIGAAPNPVDGPRKDQIGIRRVHKNGMGLELAKNVLPGTSCDRA